MREYSRSRPEEVSSVILEGTHTDLAFESHTLVVCDKAGLIRIDANACARPMEMVEPGQILFVPAGEKVKMTYPSPFSATLIKILPFEQLTDDHIDHRKVPVVVKEVTGPVTSSSVQLARTALASNDLHRWPLLTRSVRVSLAVSVVRKLAPLSTMAFDTTPFGLNLNKKARAADYIKANISKRLTIADIASEVGMSTWHFARAFKASVGMTPQQYVIKSRIFAAHNKILSTVLPLAQISDECGFSSQSHMTGVFKAYFGKTPRQFRVGD